MKLTYLSLPELRELAKRAKTTTKYLQHLATGRRQASAAMAGAIEKASGGEITRDTLCAACKSCPHLKNSRKPAG